MRSGFSISRPRRHIMKHALLLLAFVFGLTAEDHSIIHPKQGESGKHPEELTPPTLEFVTSTTGGFVNGNAMINFSKRFYAENHAYKALGGVLGFGGVGYAVLNRKNAKLISSAYATYGEYAGGGVGIRFLGKKDFKNFYLVTDAHLLQSISRHGFNNSRTFLDPTHVSLGYKWLQVGFSAEYLHYGVVPAPVDHHYVVEVEPEPDHEFGKGFRVFIEPSPVYGIGYRASHTPHGWAHIFFTEYRPDFKRLFRRH